MENEIFENLHFIVIGMLGFCLLGAGLCLLALFGGLNNAADELVDEAQEDVECDRAH